MGRRGFLFTQSTGRRVGQPCKRCRVVGALAGWHGLRLGQATGGGGVRPQPAEHEEQPHQSNQHEFIEKQGRDHDHAPSNR